jgi:hypothetical protein
MTSMTSTIPPSTKTGGDLPWDPIWQFVLGDEDESILSNNDEGSFEASTIESVDDFSTDCDSVEEYRDNTRNYVSKERYEDTLETLALYQQLAEERRLRNEALAAFQARRARVFPHSQPTPARSTKRAYALGRVESTFSTASNKSNGPVKYWPALRRKQEHDEPTLDGTVEHEFRESNTWEWELDPDIFHSVSSKSVTENAKGLTSGRRMKTINNTKSSLREDDSNSSGSRSKSSSNVRKAKNLVKKLWCRSVAAKLEEQEKIERNKTAGTATGSEGSI